MERPPCGLTAISVSGTAAIVSYLDAPSDIVVKDGMRVRVERTKNEGFLADFRHADSPSSRIVFMSGSVDYIVNGRAGGRLRRSRGV